MPIEEERKLKNFIINYLHNYFEWCFPKLNNLKVFSIHFNYHNENNNNLSKPTKETNIYYLYCVSKILTDYKSYNNISTSYDKTNITFSALQKNVVFIYAIYHAK